MTTRSFRAATAALVAFVLIASACGDDTDVETGVSPTTTASSAAEPTSTDPETTDETSAFAGSYTISDATYGTETTVTVEGGLRTIVSNGLPNHETGEFPGAGNPNAISAQDYSYTLPTSPNVATVSSYNVPQAFGIATNGVVLDPFAAEWYQNDANSGWQLAALANGLGIDDNNAHVQPTGAYHYHATPTPLVTTTSAPVLLGWAGDGFPIYSAYGYADADDVSSGVVELNPSYQLKAGDRPDGPGGTYDGTYIEDYEYVAGSGDLDECNGRTGVTAEYPEGTYYYVATNAWPYLGRCFVGDIADSFVKGPGGR